MDGGANARKNRWEKSGNLQVYAENVNIAYNKRKYWKIGNVVGKPTIILGVNAMNDNATL